MKIGAVKTLIGFALLGVALFGFLVNCYFYGVAETLKVSKIIRTTTENKLKIKCFTRANVSKIAHQMCNPMTPKTPRLNEKSRIHTDKKRRTKTILFYNPAVYHLSRHVKKYSKSLFRKCEIKQCEMVFDKSHINASHAVLLNSFWGLRIAKKPGQIWIMLQIESPQMHDVLARRSAPVHLRNMINWTISYSTKADIYLPYGQMRERTNDIVNSNRNYLQIANNKSKDAIWIVSHCKTHSKRERYVEILKQYISVDVLGDCGEEWTCGRRFYHDKCFAIYNTTYRYNLAFENSLCQEYITEKFFENYKYDILQVVRGNTPHKKPIDINGKAYIDANNFKNAHELGKFLRALSRNPKKYASMLRKKDKYTVVPYMELFQRALCDVCKRLHNVDNNSSYTNIRQWMRENEPCYKPTDI